MAEEFRVLRPKEYHAQLVSKGQRADGRKLNETREIKLETDAIKTADSSSLIKFGSTSLICGCTAQLSKLTDKKDDSERIRIKVELPPICSGPTGYKNQNVSHLLTKTLREILDNSRCFDDDSFSVPDSDYYWLVDVEVICLNYDGCLLDASLLAIMSALKSLVLSSKNPSLEPQVVRLNSIPVCSTFALIGDHIIYDPDLEEENVAHMNFSITIDSATNQSCHINKVGGKSLTTSNLLKCIEIAKTRAKSVRKLIESIGQVCDVEMTAQ